MRRLVVLLCAMLLVCGITGTSGASPVYLTGVTATSGWSDVEQSHATNYCWAAGASNMLAYSGWDGGFASSSDIFGNLTSHFTDLFGNPYYAVEWWFDGVNSWQGVAGKPQASTGGNYYSTALFNSNLYWGEAAQGVYTSAWQWMKDDVDQNKVFTLNLATTSGGVHWLTGWGYDTATNAAFVTDSWDGITQAYWLPLAYTGGKWGVTWNGSDYFISSMNSLKFNSAEVPPNGGGTVPEPATVILLGTGLAGLLVRSRKRR